MGLTAISSLVIGGNIIAILLQQTMRLKAMIGGLTSAAGYLPPSVDIAGVPVSARTQEVYQYRAEVTRYAIESAKYAADHVILYPLEIELSFQLGNWYPGFVERSFDLLEDMFEARNLLDLMTEHRIIKNVVLREFRLENEAPVWGKLDCHAVFQQIPLVSIQATATPATTTATSKTGGPSADKTATPEVNSGTKTPAAPTTRQIGDFNLTRSNVAL